MEQFHNTSSTSSKVEQVNKYKLSYESTSYDLKDLVIRRSLFPRQIPDEDETSLENLWKNF